LDQENSLVGSTELFSFVFELFFFVEVREGTYRKTRVAIKISKESESASLIVREAEIMR